MGAVIGVLIIGFAVLILTLPVWALFGGVVLAIKKAKDRAEAARKSERDRLEILEAVRQSKQG
jgi:biopolymer transport protein ExbB/TolQ